MTRLEKRRAKVERLRVRLAKAKDDKKPKLADELRRAERLLAKTERRQRETAALERLADRLAERAPAVMARWRRDRDQEPRRIEKRRRELRKRVNRDTQPQRAEQIRAMGYSFAPTVVQPPPEPAAAEPAPPREGLLPGDFRLIDDVPAEPYRLPATWTSAHVGVRLIEAHKTLQRVPMRRGPKQYGAIWPEYFHEGGELVFQAGAGTLHLGRNRVRVGTSADQIARMNEALAWPLEVFADDPASARNVNDWASIEDRSSAPLMLLWKIAQHLNKRKVPVR